MRRRESDKFPLRMVVLVSQLGITMMVSLFFSLWIGYFLSEKTGNVIIFLIFIILGILAGFRSCYKIIQKFVKLDDGQSRTHKEGNDEYDGDKMDEKRQ